MNASHFPSHVIPYADEPEDEKWCAETHVQEEPAMERFAGNNGHPTANPAAGRPTRDDAYHRVAKEFLRKYSLDGDEVFTAAIARRFKEAPARVCCGSIGHWIDKNLLGFGWTQNDLADRIGVDRSAVAKWTAGGAISLGHLVVVLLEFRSDFADLPLPAREELALEGYIAALSHVRSRIDPTSAFEPLDRERFWCLFHLFSEPFWNGQSAKGPGARQERGGPGPSAGGGVAPLRAPGESSRPRMWRPLVQEWAAPWILCLELLPGGWSIR